MKKVFYIVLIVSFFVFIYSCMNKDKNIKIETLNQGKAIILVDETLLPIIEDQKQVFESQYNATLTLIGKSESEIVQLLSQNKFQIAVLARELSANESEIFVQKKIKPRLNPFLKDAIAFISNKKNNDSIIDLEKIVDFIKNKDNKSFKGLVFDNPNSSTVRLIKELSNVETLPKDKIFSFKTNNEVIQFVEKNDGMVGVVGVNWLSEPSLKMKSSVDNIKVLSVKSKSDGKFYKPSQDNIASGLYPLTREIKLINYQASAGLGMGFAKFLRNDIGQRIILKSGLVPVIMPNRNIKIRNQVNKK